MGFAACPAGPLMSASVRKELSKLQCRLESDHQKPGASFQPPPEKMVGPRMCGDDCQFMAFNPNMVYLFIAVAFGPRQELSVLVKTERE